MRLLRISEIEEGAQAFHNIRKGFENSLDTAMMISERLREDETCDQDLIFQMNECVKKLQNVIHNLEKLEACMHRSSAEYSALENRLCDIFNLDRELLSESRIGVTDLRKLEEFEQIMPFDHGDKDKKLKSHT